VSDFLTSAQGLRDRGDGLWTTDEVGEVSYPEDGHDGCRAIEDGSFWFAHRSAVLLDALGRFPPDGCVLDVGGGNGHVTKALLDAGYRAVLLEPGPAGIAHARARGVFPLVHSTLAQARFRAGSVPAAGVFDVVEHVADDVLFFRELHQALIPRGRLYVTVPAFGWLWSHADVHAGHYRRYTRHALARALAVAGFELEWLTCMFSFVAPPLFLLKSVPDKMRRPPRDRQEQAEREHDPPRPARALLKALGRAERAWLRSGRTLSVGSSVLAVARRG